MLMNSRPTDQVTYNYAFAAAWWYGVALAQDEEYEGAKVGM